MISNEIFTGVGAAREQKEEGEDPALQAQRGGGGGTNEISFFVSEFHKISC